MLEITDLHVSYGAVRAVRGVSLSVNAGEIVGLLGPNGAGKSTLLWAISGVVVPSRGAIAFRGESLLGSKPEQMAERGLALVPEGRQILTTLTVEENLVLGCGRRRGRAQTKADLSEMFERFPVLQERRSSSAGQLSGGEQQQLAIARALLQRPSLLMLDEPSLGLAPLVVQAILEHLVDLRERGVTVLLVEQNAGSALAISDRSYIVRNGEVERSGTSAELAAGIDLADAYLGQG